LFFFYKKRFLFCFSFLVFSLQCDVQNYHWGKVGEDSTVALLAKTKEGFQFDKDQFYAEVYTVKISDF